MKVSAIYLNSLYPKNNLTQSKTRDEKYSLLQKYGAIDDLYGMPFVYPIAFTSIQNSSKLRLLFGYGLPCIYTGVTMIDPKQLSRMLKNQTFLKPSKDVMEILSKYDDSYSGMEKKALDVLKQRAKVRPYQTISELLKEIEPYYRKEAQYFTNLKKNLKTYRKNINQSSVF